MADCQHTGRHLHCNICGGAPCADCFGSIAPFEPIKFGPTIKKDFPSTIAALHAQLAEAQAARVEFKRDAIALEELRVVVAEIEGQDTKTWPGHGNKALAIAALYKLNHDAIEKQRAQLAARDAEVGRLTHDIERHIALASQEADARLKAETERDAWKQVASERGRPDT